MYGMRTCEKCRKTIRGKMIYAGGGVWHPKCYPFKKKIKSKR
jgi:hypothetical protein